MTQHRTIRLDTTYLSVHPRTQAWWNERAKCEACIYLVKREKVMNCCIGTDTGERSPCIKARDPAGVCGTEARLFRPR